MLPGLSAETGVCIEGSTGGLGGAGGQSPLVRGVVADFGDQEAGTGGSPSDGLCGHDTSSAICKMGPSLALPSPQVSGEGEWRKESEALPEYQKGDHTVGTS